MLEIPLGPFLLNKLIGVGGAGEVWQGVHVSQQEPVAVKVITAARARDLRYREAFRNEVRAVAGLDHPGIVMVLDTGEVDAEAENASRGRIVSGSPYLAMALAEAGSLRSVPLPGTWPGLRAWLLWLLDTLAHAHANGVIHRDLKPGNVLVFRDASQPDDAHGASKLKLTDFGLAHAANRAERVIKGTSGTPIFMAPEQFMGKWRDFGPCTDLYALGCMAYALATGQPPFRGKGVSALAQMHLHDEAPPIVSRLPTPRGFEAWVKRLMHKEPTRRFQCAADAAFALLRLGEAELGDGGSAPADLLDTGVGHTLTATWPDWEAEPAGELTPGPIDGLSVRQTPPLPRSWRLDLPPPPSMRLIGAGLGLYGLRAVPLVGRETERDRLWKALGQVRRTGLTRAVVLRGAAGTGKTRLAQWVAQRADEVGNAVVVHASHSTGNGPTDGLARMVSLALGCVGMSRVEMSERVRQWLEKRGVFEELEHHAVMELVWPLPEEDEKHGQRVLRFGSANERYALIHRLLGYLASQVDEGAQRPVILMLDDVQWGADALGFARYLLGRVGDGTRPILILCTLRDEALQEREVESAELERLIAQKSTEVVVVEPLDPHQRRELVERLLFLEGDVAEQVIERTAGNPLFAVQLVGDWVQRGVLQVGQTGFVLRPGERATLPDDIHQLWEERIQRALEGRSADDRSALELGALMGSDVESAEWRGACRVAGLVVSQDLITHLIERRLARDLPAGWAFAHGMLRESLARSAREQGRWERLHDACATTLQIRYEVARQPGIADRLGRHLFEAGKLEEALAPLRTGAIERRAMSDYGGALGLLDLRDSILADLTLPESDERFGEGFNARADLLIGLGRLAEAEEVARRVMLLGVEHHWDAMLAPAHRHAASAAAKLGRLSEAEDLLLHAEQFARDVSDDRELARSVLFLGDVFRLQGRHAEAMLCCKRALGRFGNLGDKRGQADTLAGMAAISQVQGDLDTAERTVREAIPLYEAVGGRFGMASSRNTLGDVLRARGELDSAVQAYREAERLLRSLGSPESFIPQLNQGLMLLAAGQVQRARAPLTEVLQAMLRTGRRAVAGACHAALLAPVAAAGEEVAFYEHLAEAESVLGATGFVDPDIAQSAVIGAEQAEAMGYWPGAMRAWGLALAQWERLGRDEAARAARGRLAACQGVLEKGSVDLPPPTAGH